MYNILGKSAYWIINKKLTKSLGLEEVLFLSDLIDKNQYFKNESELSEDGFFFNTVERIEKEIGLSYRKQKRVIASLKEKDIISTYLKGFPTRLYFRINYNAIRDLLEGVEKKIKPKIKYKDKFETKEHLTEAVNMLYSAYPSRCVVKGSATGKSKSSKLKIGKLLREHTSQELLHIIEGYVEECRKSKVFMKHFNTFLNNLPELNDMVGEVKYSKEIIELVKWLSSKYIMKEPDNKSDEAAKKLIELGYKNNDFLNQFLL